MAFFVAACPCEKLRQCFSPIRKMKRCRPKISVHWLIVARARVFVYRTSALLIRCRRWAGDNVRHIEHSAVKRHSIDNRNINQFCGYFLVSLLFFFPFWARAYRLGTEAFSSANHCRGANPHEHRPQDYTREIYCVSEKVSVQQHRPAKWAGKSCLYFVIIV